MSSGRKHPPLDPMERVVLVWWITTLTILGTFFLVGIVRAWLWRRG